jgi:hypothetical protein
MGNPSPSTPSDGTGFYLGRLKRLPLLTRDAETEVAKRIETDEHEVLAALGDCRAGRKVVSGLGVALRRGDLGACDIARGFDEDDPEWEGRERRRLLRQVATVGSPAASARTVTTALEAMP